MLENCEATVECFLNDFDLVTVESNDFLTVGAFSSSFELTKLGKSVAALLVVLLLVLVVVVDVSLVQLQKELVEVEVELLAYYQIEIFVVIGYVVMHLQIQNHHQTEILRPLRPLQRVYFGMEQMHWILE